MKFQNQQSWKMKTQKVGITARKFKFLQLSIHLVIVN